MSEPIKPGVNDERKHLEGLLKDRINFYIIFASVFVAGLPEIKDDQIRVAALATMTLVSFLLGYAVVRTHRLVGKALDEIEKDDIQPLTRWRKEVKIPGNANNALVWVPVIVTIFFFCVTVHYGRQYIARPQFKESYPLAILICDPSMARNAMRLVS